jgi:hypothetical protein
MGEQRLCMPAPAHVLLKSKVYDLDKIIFFFSIVCLLYHLQRQVTGVTRPISLSLTFEAKLAIGRASCAGVLGVPM